MLLLVCVVLIVSCSVWCKSKDGKMTGRSGKGMSLQADAFSDYMRLCFAWLTDKEIVAGVQYLANQ